MGSIPNSMGISSVNNEEMDAYWGAIQRAVNFDESLYY